jgi:hypothetical protein
MQTCKPGSVFPNIGNFYHLSGMTVASHLYQPTLRHQAGNPNPDLHREAGLFGFSTRGVYLAATVASCTGELLPRLFTLTSYPGCPGSLGGLVSVALSMFLWQETLSVRKRGALRCPDFPPRFSSGR